MTVFGNFFCYTTKIFLVDFQQVSELNVFLFEKIFAISK